MMFSKSWSVKVCYRQKKQFWLYHGFSSFLFFFSLTARILPQWCHMSVRWEKWRYSALRLLKYSLDLFLTYSAMSISASKEESCLRRFVNLDQFEGELHVPSSVKAIPPKGDCSPKRGLLSWKCQCPFMYTYCIQQENISCHQAQLWRT